MDDRHAPRFQVPRIQRTYAWRKKEISDFIKDLVHVSRDEDSEHYFGAFCTMSTSGDDNAELIIDGQQRIATSLLFLKYAQKIVVDSILKDRISKIIAANNLKVTLGKRDHETFKNIMDGRVVNDQKSLLNSAYKSIGSLLKEQNQEKIVIDKLVFTLLDRFRLVKINLLHNKFGYTFHLVNYRGKPLTQSELIKSHIFIDLETAGGIATVNLDKLDERWTEMAKNISAPFGNAGKPVDVFIQYVLSIKYGQINLTTIYEKFISDLKAINTNKAQPRGKIWLEELFDWAERYMLLLTPPDQFSKPWKEGRLDTKKWLQRIKELKAVNVYPVLLAGYAKYYNTDPHSFYKLVDSCYRFHIRVITLGALDVSAYTKFMQNVAHKIWTNKLATQAAVIRELSNYIKTCEKQKTIKTIGSAISYMKSTQARHCLLLIEEYNYGVEKVANNPTVEHVLPRKFEGSEWEVYIKRVYSDDPDYWISNLGNMTLLSRSLNAEAKRKLFRDKFRTYNSNYGITQELKKKKSWNITDIEERCNKYEEDLKSVLNISEYPTGKHSTHQ